MQHCSRFKRINGDTSCSLNKRLRLQSAAADFVMGAEPVGQVALRVGYRKERKFAAEFKKELGRRSKNFRKEVCIGRTVDDLAASCNIAVDSEQSPCRLN
ncbi:MAG: helix-turn-helix domain-containing protein [Candidatus Methanomethylophilaceae archaeon]|nr:helix-turn-helix domain-containing protein [Candidatus Methanomethylophilaceae archaeon]MBR4216880.1 helix-turn-helix domain-containing protein [Candidatus Methanomethylophilaceae archaeon]